MYSFDQLVNREGLGSIKEKKTPDYIAREGLVSYWGAEFEFPTCPAFSAGVEKCVKQGFYPYTVQTDDYNKHVCWWMKNVRSWDILPEWIIPTHGTIFSLATTIRLIVPKEKKVILVHPGYNRYQQAAVRLGRECTFCSMTYDASRASYSFDMKSIERALSDPGNALLVLCNPNNPTGFVLDETQLKEIDRLSKKYSKAVFSDEIFSETVRKGECVTPYGKICSDDSMAITCTSLGKCMSLTGVNHANVIIRNPELREEFIRQRNEDHYGSIDPMLYSGLISAYTEDGQKFVDALNDTISVNYAYLCKNIEKILPGARVIRTNTTYLAWVDYSALGLTDDELARFLNFACFIGDNGEEYGASNQFYRYSIAVPLDAIKKSIKRIELAAAEFRHSCFISTKST